MPFCPDKKMSGQKIVGTKKISENKNCPDKKIVRTKKLSRQKNCPDKKIVRAKKLSRKKNCSDKKIVRTKFFSIFLSDSSTKAWYFISEIFYSFLAILWALVITTCLIKLLTKLTKISLKILSPKVYEILF